MFELLLVATIPCLFLLAIFRTSPGHNYRLCLWLLPLIGFVVARAAVLPIIDASSLNGMGTDYLKTTAGTLAVTVIVVNAQAVVVVRQRFAAKIVDGDVEPRTAAT
jgi:hypothetical protein